MKIVSFVREGVVDCGLMVESGIRLLDEHKQFGQVAPSRRLGELLRCTDEERRKLNEELLASPTIPLSEVRLTSAVPLCPLYLLAHGNSPVVWKRQMTRHWEMPRLPFLRIRSFNSFAGNEDDLALPPNATLSVGAELGVVIGKPAYRVAPEEAVDHIAGLVLLNDAFVAGAHDRYLERQEEAAAHQNQGVHCVYKNADGAGGVGPWITTREELAELTAKRMNQAGVFRYTDVYTAPWLYDKLMQTHVNDELADESYTAAYLLGAEWLIWYLARFMTLPTGTIVGLGAAGWDGVTTSDMAFETATDTVTVTVKETTLGQLKVRARRMRAAEVGSSPLLAARRKAGLTPTPSLEERGSRAVWMLRGNNALTDDGVTVTAMNPVMLPSASVGDGSRPLVIPPHATSLFVSAQLGGVVGSEALYQRAAASECAFEGVTLVLGLRDSSLQDALRQPEAYERRAAWLLGTCANGFVQIGSAYSVADVANWRRHTVIVHASGTGFSVPLERSYHLQSYRHDLDDMAGMITTTATLLPGDVLCLGSPGEELVLNPQQVVERIFVSSSWGASLEIEVDDQRSPDARELRR